MHSQLDCNHIWKMRCLVHAQNASNFGMSGIWHFCLTYTKLLMTLDKLQILSDI